MHHHATRYCVTRKCVKMYSSSTQHGSMFHLFLLFLSNSRRAGKEEGTTWDQRRWNSTNINVGNIIRSFGVLYSSTTQFTDLILLFGRGNYYIYISSAAAAAKVLPGALLPDRSPHPFFSYVWWSLPLPNF